MKLHIPVRNREHSLRSPSFTAALTAVSGLLLIAHAQSTVGVRHGVVRSANGEPLDRVWVQQLGTWRGGPTLAGRFEFPTSKSVTLLLVRDGFEPQVRVVSASEDRDS